MSGGDDWKPGDLALCVNNSCPRIGGYRQAAGLRFRKGALYTVSAVLACSISGLTPGTHLQFLEDDPGKSAGAWRFIKVTPREADEFDREVIEQMTGKPVKGPAT